MADKIVNGINMGLVKLKEVREVVTALNASGVLGKKELLIRGRKPESLAVSFCKAMEKLNDAGKLDDVPALAFDYYNKIVPGDEEPEAPEDENENEDQDEDQAEPEEEPDETEEPEGEDEPEDEPEEEDEPEAEPRQTKTQKEDKRMARKKAQKKEEEVKEPTTKKAEKPAKKVAEKKAEKPAKKVAEKKAEKPAQKPEKPAKEKSDIKAPIHPDAKRQSYPKPGTKQYIIASMVAKGGHTKEDIVAALTEAFGEPEGKTSYATMVAISIHGYKSLSGYGWDVVKDKNGKFSVKK
jgi:hypothetical protein